jgi:DNA-binding NtrC family response regulator
MTTDDKRELGPPRAAWNETSTELDVSASASVEGPVTGDRIYLVIRNGDRAEVLDIDEADVVTIGRGAEATLMVDDARISRLHARIRREGGVLVVEDLGSRNGTRINGEVLRDGECRVAGGDIVQIGSAEIVVAAMTFGQPDSAPGAPDLAPNGIIVADPAMARVFRVAQRLAKLPTTVLLVGETGVGKEVVAEQIHRASARARRPFVRLNCAALPPNLLAAELFGHERGAFTGADQRKAGFFEAAHTGTLLLDEIGEVPAATQVTLLRVLETRRLVRLGGTVEIPVDVRVLCATHRDLERDVAEGRFRQDLFYRISAFQLEVPPLRTRPAEIALLAEFFARKLAARTGVATPRFTAAATSLLSRHAWPGNVRELRNAVEHAFVLAESGVIGVEHLPDALRGAVVSRPPIPRGPIRTQMAEIEKKTLEEALAAHSGNRTRTAEKLGISRRTLLYKMAKYGIRR